MPEPIMRTGYIVPANKNDGLEKALNKFPKVKKQLEEIKFPKAKKQEKKEMPKDLNKALDTVLDGLEKYGLTKEEIQQLKNIRNKNIKDLLE